MYSNLINLQEFFVNLNDNEDYCILRMPETFPNYYEYSDLDILCKDRTRMLDYINRFLKQYNNIDIKIHYPKNGQHTHIDIYPKGKSLDFKFDLIDSFSIYKKSTINPGLEDSILSNKVIKKNACVPSVPHEMVVRMLEYVEYKDTRPDKIKHLGYVQTHHKYNAEFNNLWNAFVKESNGTAKSEPQLMILVRLVGGLGNQMFQYATALALGWHWQCPVKVDIRHYDRPDSRTYSLDRYKLAPVIATTKELEPFESASAFLQRYLRRFVPLYQPTHTIYRQWGFRYDPGLIKLRPPVFLQRGYFQSEKFFLPYAETIRDVFQLKYPLPSRGEALRKQIQSTPWPVAVHVRCGDYLTLQHVYRLCTRAYYEQAVKIIHNLSGKKATYFVFSDDIVAARKMLSFIPDAVFVTPHEDQPWVDMNLIATCRDAIIANSSFSWWGAWLNPHPDKHIIAPRLWFRRLANQDIRDLIPLQWHSLEV